jgi:hypothetical protein
MHLHFFKKIWRLPQSALKRFVSDLLRLLLLSRQPRRMARAGFVLPTTVLLTLMVVLTATALTYRAFSRSEQNIAQREQQVIVNAATPAIDRAKAKIEFLFRQDPRFPSGLPASDILYDLMSTRLTNDSAKNFAGYTGRVSILQGGFDTDTEDPYTLADETRVDINDDGLLDNAWSFPSEGQTIVYSILVDDSVDETEASEPGEGENFLPRPYATDSGSVDVAEPVSSEKAKALVTRTGPLATTEATPKCKGALAEGGWQIVDASSGALQKNFQVNAFVASGDDVGQTFETLEFQQSREATRGNKWGAWFRYDLEIFPGRAFNWNGAMHTDSNLLINRDTVQLHMVSSHNSCVYSRESSEITLGTTEGFQGQVVKGTMKDNNYPAGNNPLVHVFDGIDRAPRLEAADVRLTNSNHSVTNGKPSDISVDALTLFTQDKTKHVRDDNWTRRDGWDTTIFADDDNGRTINDPTARPFVDDFYRADDRWGPKPRYDDKTSAFDLLSDENVAAGLTIGDEISPSLGKLIGPDGLDGYWERQAIRSGLRVIVGQRLELGNNQGWNTVPTGLPLDGDPLYPAKTKPTNNTTQIRFGGNHEYLQRRSLRDNLAAVQGMVVYHYQGGNGITNSGEFPAACVALTAHPGTRQTIVNSRTFGTYDADGSLKVDFLNGQGTNGWEFQFPADFNTEGKFGQELATGQPLGNALRNLAYFAGDPAGGAPSFKPVQDSSSDPSPQIHPAPYLSMWGDFSPLRRIFADFDAASGSSLDRYNALSFADKATLHSAACNLSMLAYNLQSEYDQVRSELSSENAQFRDISNELREGMFRIVDYLETGNDDENGDGTPDGKIAALFSRLRPELQLATWNDLVDGSQAAPDGTIPLVPGCTIDPAGFQKACDVGEYFADFTLADWRIVLDETTDATESQMDAIEDFVGKIANGLATVRDRELGFSPGGATVKFSALSGKDVVTWDASTQLTELIETYKENPDTGTILTTESFVLKSQCDPDLFADVISPSTPFKDDQVALALVACSQNDKGATEVKYPSLFYLFPVVPHDLRGSGANAQPDLEEYIADAYVNDVNPTAVQFEVVGTDPIEGIKAIEAEPSSTTLSNWVLPASTLTGIDLLRADDPLTTGVDESNVDDLEHAFVINVDASVVRVPFLDKGIFDGREQLNNRVLDIDLDVLTTETVNVTNGDFWLPANLENQAEGVFFAFREDAVREDEIVRPLNSTATNCTGISSGITRRYRIETQAACRMQARAGSNGQDPPLTAQLISLKPVDFIADPERRVHGFRLRTASGEPADFSGPDLARKVGMTMVTDNPVYIMGDFNPHSTDGTTSSIVEEFVETLYDQPVGTAFGRNFYNDRETLNTENFANLDQDHWRPVEVLSDAIYVLSVGFLDGAVEDGFLRALPASQGGDATTTSYMNQNRPRLTTTLTPDSVIRHQLDETGSVTSNSPVFIDRNGTYYLTTGNTPFYSAYNSTTSWINFTSGDAPRRQNVQTAEPTFVNAVFVSGIVPKRPQQGYGGLHNYPRFIEYWEGQDLHIAGSFIQLNFSTTATGPYEQDAWEDGADPQSSEPIGYYEAPNRRWGYDVGLLYVPPGPAARRFVNIGAPRSEYYREIPSDDPYIVNLRCARDADGNFVLGDDICPA